MELELTSEELLIADEIVAVCKRLYRRNCLAAADGNMDDPNARELGEAYLQAIDLGKHGGKIRLRADLRARVGLE